MIASQPYSSYGRSEEGVLMCAPASSLLVTAKPDITQDVPDRLHDMQRAFRAVGGVVSGDWLVGLLLSRTDQPISQVARWIVNRQVVSFDADGLTWLPLFQFDRDRICLTDAAQRVITELRDVFDDWELTQWFAEPNAWLEGAAPAVAIAFDIEAVVHAARADRFVAAG